MYQWRNWVKTKGQYNVFKFLDNYTPAVPYVLWAKKQKCLNSPQKINSDYVPARGINLCP